MNFANIPQELRAYRQWICWQLQERDGAKPTKIPVNPYTGFPASVTDPSHWASFEDACANAHKFSGIGFVFTRNDPFCGIDLDDTHGDGEAYTRQVKIFQSFASYSELSPSGRGLHIICKAKLPGKGRRRASIEMYDCDRYFTMTGNVYSNVPIAERQELAEILYNKMGGPVEQFVYGQDQAQKQTDEQVLAVASGAANGDKFNTLYSGNWQNLYPSQSEADFALIDIIAFYTQNRAQIKRMFRASALGQRDKAKRDAYLDYMIEKSFDRQLPPIDIDGLRIAWDKMQEERKAAQLLDVRASVAPQVSNSSDIDVAPPVVFPQGLIGEIADFILAASPRPVPQIALVGAIGFLAGICGRAYNVRGTGLNQYLLLVARTGRGKEAIKSGIDKLVAAIQPTHPTIAEFKGPGEIASPQALLKWINRAPCVYSIVGEFGLKLKEMSNPHANPNVAGLKRTLLDLYGKSGRGNTLDAMAYSDRDKNTAVVQAPCFTLIGESTPSKFYENVSEDMVADGLVPRFMIFDYEGERVADNEAQQVAIPPDALVLRVKELVAHIMSLQSRNIVCEIQFSPEARDCFRQFNIYCDGRINAIGEKQHEVSEELWNRAHLKSMKLAALYAVGCNYISPVITGEQARSAIDTVYNQTHALKKRFDNGEIGGGSVAPVSNDAKQLEILIRVISNLANKSFNKARTHRYRISDEMQRDMVFPFNTVLMHAQVYPVFRNDRRGSSEAIRKAYQQLLDADDIREMNKKQMQEKYGKTCRAFCISNPEKFTSDD